jgi:protein tyrosine phosphatase (PTP) superfamily phosphohydrolase (DUF442 family)
MNRKQTTVTVKDNEIHAFQRQVAKAGGTIVRSCMTGQGYTVTYVL